MFSLISIFVNLFYEMHELAMLQMKYQFKHSLIMMSKLAKDTAWTPPSEDDPPFKYVDQSLTILSQTFNANNERMQQEFLN